MNRIAEIERMSTAPMAGDWNELADRVLNGHRLTPDEAFRYFVPPTKNCWTCWRPPIACAANGSATAVRLNFLINAKSGLCGEDCGYCSQSRVSKAEIPRYALLTADQILDGARMAAQRKAKTYCIVTSGRGPTDSELDSLAQAGPADQGRTYGLKICVSVGLLRLEQAQRLKPCGVDRVNHNLNTSRRFYPQICTTHTYQDRLDTLRAVRQAGLEICSGGIVGMGEEDADVVELALRTWAIRVEAVPVNFFTPIAGTPVAAAMRSRLSAPLLPEGPWPCSGWPIRVASCGWRPAANCTSAGCNRLGLYAANSMFVGDYLTTKGQPPKRTTA